MKREFWSGMGSKILDDKSSREKLDKLVNAGVQLYSTGLDRKYEYRADKKAVVLAARAGYDPFALLDVLTTVDSINPVGRVVDCDVKNPSPHREKIEISQ